MPEHASIQAHVIIASALSLAIATISLLLRFAARRLNRQHFFVDDWLILAALISEWAISISGLILVHNGLGLHIKDVNPTKLTTYLKVLYTGAPLYALTIVLIKLSLLVLYHRVLPMRFMTYSCLIVGTVVISWGLTSSLMGILLCDPVHKAWSPESPGQCLNLVQFYYGLQIPNIITDVIILALPIRPIWRLRCSRRQKLMLACIFGVGSLVVVFDVVRLIAMLKLEGNGEDFTWNQVPTAIWTSIEPAIAILTACLPHIKPIVIWVQHYFRIGTESQQDLATTDEETRSPIRSPIRSPSEIHNTAITPSTGRREHGTVWEKSPSHCSIDFMAHINSNIGELKHGPPEHAHDRSSDCGVGFIARSEPPRWEGPAWPDAIKMFDVHDSEDPFVIQRSPSPSPMIFSSPFTSSSSPHTLPSSPCPSCASVDTVVGIESVLAEIEYEGQDDHKHGLG